MSSWWALVEFYESFLVWPLAIAIAWLLFKAKGFRGVQIFFGVILVLLFTPHIQGKVGDVYFDHLCRTQAGEFIYRTVDNVEGVLQMRPRDGSKDYFDRMREGDIPEDPWGHTNAEAQQPWSLIGKYRYIETVATSMPESFVYERGAYDASMSLQASEHDKIARYFGYNGRELRSFRKEFSAAPRSQYGFTWRENRSWLDQLFNVYPGEVAIKMLTTDETLAVSRGYFRVLPMQTCPPGKDDFLVRRFLEKVLRPAAVIVEN
jgi:hypothetical protein